MSEDSSEGLYEAAARRLEKLLQVLEAQGLTQAEVARRTGISGTFLNDLKTRRKPLRELVARRMAEAFSLDHRWLLAEAGTLDIVPIGAGTSAPEADTVWLPLLPHPVRGRPHDSRAWDGSHVPLCGLAAARARGATHPYVLRFSSRDLEGELKRHDLILISQSPSDSVTISVIKEGRKLCLARRTPNGWRRLAKQGDLDKDRPLFGHVLGIVWRGF
jgi:transcriptional regulator with XRE-family HTH domain